MAWNQPGKNGPEKNPWGNDRHQDPDSGNKHSTSQHGPPDLDKLIRQFFTKYGLFGSKRPSGNKSFYGLAGLAVAVGAVLWAGSGLYTVGEAERGVVTRFGKFSHLVDPGLNWKPTFIDNVQTVNVEAVRELATTGAMLTADENVVRVEMNVQYRVTNPQRYLYAVVNADESLRQATDSALRGVIGRSTMDRVLTEGRTVVRSETQREIEQTIQPYNMGVTVVDVNFQAARPPEEVKAAFDDAIAARENREQYVREAEAYANEVQPQANGQAQRILEEARAYKARTVLEAQGEVARFAQLLPEYNAAPVITKQRLYIDTMEKILARTPKVLISNTDNKVMLLPLDQLLNRSHGGKAGQLTTPPPLTLDPSSTRSAQEHSNQGGQ